MNIYKVFVYVLIERANQFFQSVALHLVYLVKLFGSFDINQHEHDE